jgi:serine/threonine protein kinase
LLEAAQQGAAKLEGLRGYTLVQELGRGGMGAVYLVRVEQTGEQAALKLMLPRAQADPRCRDLFLREAENTRALRHPNVVEVRQVGCWKNLYFLVLEYCAGGSADALLARAGGRMPVDAACSLILQVLTGLEYAHEAEIPVRLADQGVSVARGLLHRDLKPRNLFLSSLDAAATVKIGDYGLAKAFDLAGLSGQTSTGTTAGTPLFMPRQQVINFKYARPEVDVWAAAATLYHMLTGAYPRDFPPGVDPWAVVLETNAIPIRRRLPALPEQLAEVIDHALVDRPRIGFAAAAELRRAIEGAL